MKENLNKATTGVILETRKLLQDGRYPVKLRITFKRKQKYYTLTLESIDNTKETTEAIQEIYDVFGIAKGQSITLSKEDFNKVMGNKPRLTFKVLRSFLNSYEKLAIETINSLSQFTFESFEDEYFNKSTNNKDLFSYLSRTAEEVTKADRISTGVTYSATLKSLKTFTEKEVLPFDEVNVTFLNRYEKWMIDKGKSSTTIGIYTRNIRAVVNKAIRDGIFKGVYPFGRDRYEVPTGKNVKKALTLSEIGMIVNYPAIKGTNEQRYRDYWLFSYLCNGINIRDMARLKYSNIVDDIITFQRVKTKREKRNPRVITVVITKLMGRIIDRWGNKPARPNDYIFPIFSNGLTAKQEYSIGNQAIRMINTYIDRIAKDLEMSQHVTSYTARHSFATVLKRSGASIELISESLGHTNKQTTQNYLADFETDVKRKWAAELERF
jgi:integrase